MSATYAAVHGGWESGPPATIFNGVNIFISRRFLMGRPRWPTTGVRKCGKTRPNGMSTEPDIWDVSPITISNKGSPFLFLWQWWWMMAYQPRLNFIRKGQFFNIDSSSTSSKVAHPSIHLHLFLHLRVQFCGDDEEATSPQSVGFWIFRKKIMEEPTTTV